MITKQDSISVSLDQSYIAKPDKRNKTLFQLLISLIGGLTVLLFRRNAKQQQWESLPSFEQYQTRMQHDDPSLQDRVVCKHCGSEQIWEYGVDSLMDDKREHCCLSCHATLWRSKRECMSDNDAKLIFRRGEH